MPTRVPMTMPAGISAPTSVRERPAPVAEPDGSLIAVGHDRDPGSDEAELTRRRVPGPGAFGSGTELEPC